MAKRVDGEGGHRHAVPFDDPLNSQTKTGQKIIEAASWLLANEGYDSLTHERIAQVAGVNKSSIRNNFGSKAAVVGAVVDAMIHDGCVELTQKLATAEEPDRIQGVVDGIGDLVRIDATKGFFDVLPHALRDPELRARIVKLYDWWYGEHRKWLGMSSDAQSDPNLTRLQLGMARIVAAIINGLTIQVALELIPEDCDLGPALDALSLVLSSAQKQLGTVEPAIHRENTGSGHAELGMPSVIDISALDGIRAGRLAERGH
jgi:AcrR family transcriptional regulator